LEVEKEGFMTCITTRYKHTKKKRKKKKRKKKKKEKIKKNIEAEC
jgi:hypothetical protein